MIGSTTRVTIPLLSPIPLHFCLRNRLQRAACVSSVTKCTRRTSPSSASRFAAASDYYHSVIPCQYKYLPRLRTTIIVSSRVNINIRSPTGCASCHLSGRAMRCAFELAGVDMLDEAWTTAFPGHLAHRCGGNASVHTAHSWVVTSLLDRMSEARSVLGVGVAVLTEPTTLVQLSNGYDGLLSDVGRIGLLHLIQQVHTTPLSPFR
jgi:hypothetical protein